MSEELTITGHRGIIKVKKELETVNGKSFAPRGYNRNVGLQLLDERESVSVSEWGKIMTGGNTRDSKLLRKKSRQQMRSLQKFAKPKGIYILFDYDPDPKAHRAIREARIWKAIDDFIQREILQRLYDRFDKEQELSRTKAMEIWELLKKALEESHKNPEE